MTLFGGEVMSVAQGIDSGGDTLLQRQGNWRGFPLDCYVILMHVNSLQEAGHQPR
jgi:hypothetical protein